MRPLVSVIVPVYNAAVFVENFYEMINKQSLNEIEVVFIDDCSTDNSKIVIKSLIDKDKRIKAFFQPVNSGPMCAREIGYQHATGQYLAFCDVDDEMPINALELLYNKALSTNADIVAGTIEYQKMDGTKELWVSKLSYGSDRMSAFKSLLTYEYRHNLCAKLFSRSLFDSISYKTISGLRYFEDYLLLYQLVYNSTILETISNTVYYYVQNSTSSTQLQMSAKRIECAFIAWSRVYELLRDEGSIAKELHSNLQSFIFELYYKGYNKEGLLDRLVQTYKLDEIVTVKDIIRNNSFKNASKLIVKKYIRLIHWN